MSGHDQAVKRRPQVGAGRDKGLHLECLSGAAVAERYAVVRRQCSGLEREGALIAATAIERRLPLMTRNWRHFRQVEGIRLYSGS